MNKAGLTILLASVSLILIYVIANRLNGDISTTSVDPVLVPIKKELLELHEAEDFLQLSEEDRLEKTLVVLDKIPKTHRMLQQQYAVAIAKLPDIVFYGRVIDQYGQPVKNASIWYSAENAYLSAGEGKGFIQSDEFGYFELNTFGAALVLGSIRHPDINSVVYYRVNKPNSAVINYNTTVRFLSHDNARDSLNYNNHDKKSSAYIIRVWRLSANEGAIRQTLVTNYKIGEEYTFSFNPKSGKVALSEGKTKGDLHLSCIRTPMQHYQDYGDWGLTITPVNGGIIETDDPYMNLAPVSGYKSSLEIDMTKGSPGYQHKLSNKHYYITTNNGNIFGSLKMHIKPFFEPREESCRLHIDFKINPTGSRNLELQLR